MTKRVSLCLFLIVFLLIPSQSVIGLNAAKSLSTTNSRTSAYHSWNEMVAELQNIANQYPNITKLVSLGKSFEGRDIWAMKISDNPDIEESEPEVYYNGNHHAREWLTPDVCLYIINYLTSNYLTNTTIKNLVDNRQLWVVPTANPDGRQYDGEDDTSASQSWRKNRNGTGIDLNRNYGYMWGGDGASSDPSAEDYRGASPFSEPETQVLRDFCLEHNFACSLSYHSYSELVLYPWGYTGTNTPINTVFDTVAKKMVDLIPNNAGGGRKYTPQKSYDLYVTSGTDVDWLYGELGIFAYCIEVYPTSSLEGGFYPPEDKVSVVCQDNLEAALYLAKIADAPPYYLAPYHVSLFCNNSNQSINPNATSYYYITIKNDGFSSDSYTLTTAQISGWEIALNQTTISLGNNQTANITLTVKPNATALGGKYLIKIKATSAANSTVNDTVRVKTIVPDSNDVGINEITSHVNNGTYSCGFSSVNATIQNHGIKSQNNFNISCDITEIIKKGVNDIVLSENFDNNGNLPSGWNNTTWAGRSWEMSNDSSRYGSVVGGSDYGAVCDSDKAGSSVNVDSWLKSPVLNCTAYSNVTLQFYHKYNWYSENSTKGAYVYLSIDSGSTWPYEIMHYYTVDVEELKCIDVSTYAGGKANVRFGWRYIANYDWWWVIEDVSVRGTTPTITQQVFTNNKTVSEILIQNDTKNLTWNYNFANQTRYVITIKTLLENDEKALNNAKIIEIDLKLVFKLEKGLNLITLPYMPSSLKAKDLAANISYCTKIGMYNTTAQNFEFYDKATETNNFDLQSGGGYLVYVNSSSSFYINGSYIKNTTLNLSKNWNSIGWFNNTVITAVQLANKIPNCTAVAYWDNTQARFIVSPLTGNISNFNIEQGKGYLVYLSSGTIWENK